MTQPERNASLRLVTLLLVLLALGVAGRLLPHPPNVAPIAALALFGGFAFQRGPALALAGGALLVSDAVIGFYAPILMASVYLGLLFPVVFRAWLRQHLSVLRIGTAAVAGSLVFFVTSNLAVWAFSGWYPRTLDGLAACFLAALPFFQYTLLGDLLWAGVLFGAYAVITQRKARAITCAALEPRPWPAAPDAARYRPRCRG
jgi:hypothetical protein